MPQTVETKIEKVEGVEGQVVRTMTVVRQDIVKVTDLQKLEKQIIGQKADLEKNYAGRMAQMNEALLQVQDQLKKCEEAGIAIAVSAPLKVG
jgi:hypothetical protein